MKKGFWLFLLVLLTILVPPPDIMAAGPPPVGGTLPDFTLPSPGSSAERDYLGLRSGGNFTVLDINAKVVLIEIFSMYCPFCQKDAPNMNAFYEAIEKNPNAKGKIKIVGIGAGNSAYEVEVFRKKYSVPFPLLPDPDFTLHKKLGETRTPYFIAVQIGENKSHRVIYSKLGSFGDVNAFLETILKASAMK